MNRRHLLQGLTLLGCGAGALWQDAARALAPGSPASLPVLAGPDIKLVIAPLRFDVTGRRPVATAVNGSVPGPILRVREGDLVRIHVTNQLTVPTSIHWHGIRLPADQDGVPGLSFPGIFPGQTFTYQFPIRQAGTYWYHSHSGMQEQTGLSGPLLLVPREPEPYHYDRDYVVMLTDWTDENPLEVLANLKEDSDYYNYHRRTLGTFVADARRQGLAATLRDRLMWGRMRMSPTDIMDVTGSTYTFLLNGHAPGANWTALFEAGEKVRLRFINGSSMTTFDVRIPGLPLTVVAADGSDIQPVTVGEFRIAVAETYDVIVQPPKDAAYSIFAQAEDRSGYARGTLAPRRGMAGVIPPMDPRPLRTMADMGMSMTMDMSQMPDMDMGDMQMGPANAGRKPISRLSDPGDGLENNGRRVLLYSDLKSLKPHGAEAAVDRDIEFHLTGNMRRFVWGLDGKKFSGAKPVRVKLGERVRFVLINDTMMEHPMHLHGFLFELENGHAGSFPLKHTVNVKPNERLSFVFTADTPGHWAFHCHLLYHMEAGMFRTVLVA